MGDTRWGLGVLVSVGGMLWSAEAAAQVVPHCGDGRLNVVTEECDDGNAVAGDGCSATCTAEPGFVCRGQPHVCAVTCGDGVVAPTEQCDDGNTAAGDGCSATCTVEDAWDCASPKQSLYVRRHGINDCRNLIAANVTNAVLTPADTVPGIGAGHWRARYVGGIVAYGGNSLYTAGLLAMTHSGQTLGVCLNGGTEGPADCIYGDRSTEATQLASVLANPRQELYDFTSTNDEVRVGLVDDDCRFNSGDVVTYRFDNPSVCSPNDTCGHSFLDATTVAYLSGSDAFNRDPATLAGADFIPSPKRPGALYTGTDVGTVAPNVGAVLRFSFAAPRILTDFYLWQNYGSDTEGLTQFGLTFRDAAGTAIGAEQLFTTSDCNCLRVPASRFAFAAVSGVSSVDLRVIQSENGTHAQLVDTLFVGAPYCNDGNVCTTDSCAAGLCSTTPVAAGQPGTCGGGLVCSGPAANVCVMPAPTIEAPAAGAVLTNTTPTISGACVTGTTVTVFEGAREVCSASCVDSAYSCVAAEAFTLGAHTITASQATDTTTGLASGPTNFDIEEPNDGGVDGGASSSSGGSSSGGASSSGGSSSGGSSSGTGGSSSGAGGSSSGGSGTDIDLADLDVTGGACSQAPIGSGVSPWWLLAIAAPFARRRGKRAEKHG